MSKLRYFLFMVLFLSPSAIFAEEIKIVFSGQANAALYHCSCPNEPDGGVARRSTFVRDMRSHAKNVLLLEAGNSFAGGSEDQHTQNVEKDKLRTEIYLNALKIMGYDSILGVTKGDVIKKFGSTSIGVLGLIDKSKEILKKRISDVKKRGASLIILLSSFKVQEDQELLKDIKGVDIVINGSPSFGSVNLIEDKGVIYLTTWWQARKMGVLSLDVSDGKIIKKSLEGIRMSSDIPDDDAFKSLVPICFQDKDCSVEKGSIAKCENGATLNASCSYAQMSAVALTVIQPSVCNTCRTQEVVQGLQKAIDELKVSYLDENDVAAGALMREFKVKMLPAYILSLDIEKTAYYNTAKNFLEKGEDGYLLKPERSGVSYILGRVTMPDTLDVFLNFQYPQLAQFLSLLKTFNKKYQQEKINFHFLVIRDEKTKEFIAKGNETDKEEFARAACVDKIYPNSILDYLICRTVKNDSGSWNDCAKSLKMDSEKIKTCVNSALSRDLVAQKIGLAKELGVSTGPTFIIDNKEIVSVVNVPSLEEFEGAVKGKQNKN